MNPFVQAAADHYGSLPSLQAPSIQNKDYPQAVRLASMAKFGGHASPQEAELFWREFQGMGMSPEEFEHTLNNLAPMSFVYHGRPPTMKELVQFKDAKPADVRAHYASLPDRHYPEVPAGDMIKYLKMAEPHAQEHFGRRPVKYEAAMFAASSATSGMIASHYQGQAAQEASGESVDHSGGQPGVPSQGAAGQWQSGPASGDSRLAAGTTPSGGALRIHQG